MRPEDLQVIGEELAIRWADGREQFIPLEKLRRACPCAGCQGEKDIFGKVHSGKPHSPQPNSFRLVGLHQVGGYAIQPVWADGHATGLYTWNYLSELNGNANEQ